MARGGGFYATGDLGGLGLSSQGMQDGSIVLFDAAGTYVWSTLYGDFQGQANKGLGFDAAGYLYMTAYQMGVIDIGNGPKSAGGGEDIFAAKLMP